MSFTFEITRPQPVGFVKVVIRSPEFGDVSEFGRRQARGESEAGSLFTQDLGVDLEFYDPTWTNLNIAERRDLEFFFGPLGTNYSQRVFVMGVQDNKCLAFPIGTSQGHSTAQALQTGQLIFPTTASFGEVRLEQSEISFQSLPRDRYTTSLRFRILNPLAC